MAAATDRVGLPRGGTADRVADVLRNHIVTGLLTPAMRLSEQQLGETLGVSRNTLREAFRILVQEGLLVHQLNRGVLVRRLTAQDITDLYVMRRAIEGSAIGMIRGRDTLDLRPLQESLHDAEGASLRQDWAALGTADMHFHSALVGLVGSVRLNAAMARVLAELRLALHLTRDEHALYSRYLLRNRMLFELLQAGDLTRAEHVLDAYLHDSEADIRATYPQTD